MRKRNKPYNRAGLPGLGCRAHWRELQLGRVLAHEHGGESGAEAAAAGVELSRGQRGHRRRFDGRSRSDDWQCGHLTASSRIGSKQNGHSVLRGVRKSLIAMRMPTTISRRTTPNKRSTAVLLTVLSRRATRARRRPPHPLQGRRASSSSSTRRAMAIQTVGPATPASSSPQRRCSV